ncbi:unnamed protein product [Mytilus edulis]|uniref:Uncharacterized protein n=1 Tax=Mytilus edulis TaxID=6550 RepID=A0A8S3QVA3_MYTED|nr:unnamed protein product [Mytilus edulis]
MFVMTENDIQHVKGDIYHHYKCFCIVIPDELLQQYIQRLFDVLTEPSFDMDDLLENRPLMHVSFRRAVRTHMRQLARETTASIIQTSDNDFFNTMFVMTEEDIKDNVENRHECFCIMIPDDLLHQYIQRLFDVLTEPCFDMDDFPENRPLMNVSFRRAVRTHMRQLAKETVALIIQTAGDDFFNTMFVMTDEDINDNAENRHECFCILIPDDLLQNYIDRWLNNSISSYFLKSAISRNKPMVNLSFCNAVRTKMRQLSTETIASIIQTATIDFFNKMFVMTEEGIKENAENKYERFGIVIPGDVLHQYIERWFYCEKSRFGEQMYG